VLDKAVGNIATYFHFGDGEAWYEVDTPGLFYFGFVSGSVARGQPAWRGASAAGGGAFTCWLDPLVPVPTVSTRGPVSSFTATRLRFPDAAFRVALPLSIPAVGALLATGVALSEESAAIR